MIKPNSYHIILKPDMQSWTFSGTVEIKMELTEPENRIDLNQLNLELSKPRIRIIGNPPQEDKTQIPRVNLDHEHQMVSFHLKEKQQGIILLEVDFKGEITDQLLGLYRSHYYYEGEKKYILVTQFEEREARKVFPCFDHPMYKTPFSVEFIIPEHLTGISNMPIEQELKLEKKDKGGNPLKRVTFQKTPPMCSYTLFFGVGDFEFIEKKEDSYTVRVAGPPGTVEHGGLALKVASRSLEEMEKYTGVLYPLEKCDHIAVQDFAFGAMENWGAVTYRENLLLVYPDQTTKQNIMTITNVIVHETSHMWFGNLVSPHDWKYIWLNESFASYFTYYITDLMHPEWEGWDDFLLSDFLGGMDRDAYRKTHPIELAGDKEFKIDSSTSPIIYNKGASFIRMLINYLGKESFQKASQHFLRTHQYTSVTTKEYWDAFSKVIDMPIKEFATSWVYQSGYPIVEVQEKNGEKIRITQRRFTYLPNDETTHWLIPISIRWYYPDGTTEEQKFLMEDPQTTVNLKKKDQDAEDPLLPDSFKINNDWTGFYRVNYEEKQWKSLGKLAKEQVLGAQDRFELVNDYFNIMLRKDIEPSDYLTFVEDYFNNEEDYLPLVNIISHLHILHKYIPDLHQKVENFGKSFADQILEKLGMEPPEDQEEKIHTTTLRNRALWLSASLGNNKINEWGMKHFGKLLEGNPPHTEIKGTIMKIGARNDSSAKKYLTSRFTAQDSTQTEKMQVIHALGQIRDSEKLQEILDFGLEKMPRNNNWILLVSMSSNPEAAQTLWAWFRENTKEFVEKTTESYVGRVIKAIVTCVPAGQLDQLKSFFQDHREELFDNVWESVELGLEYYKILERLRD